MNLLGLVARLGQASVAKRLGITPETLSRWVRKGVSARGSEKVAKAIARHLASNKAAQTRKQRDAFQSSLPVPPVAADEGLTAAEVVPRAKPTDTSQGKRVKRREHVEVGRHKIESDFNVGHEHWITIGKPVPEVEDDELSDAATEVFLDSGRDYCQVKFLFFRYIAVGSTRATIDKHGKWVDWWASTDTVSTANAIARRIEHVMGMAREAAEARIIFLEAIQVATFDRIRELPTSRTIQRRKLR